MEGLYSVVILRYCQTLGSTWFADCVWLLRIILPGGLRPLALACIQSRIHGRADAIHNTSCLCIARPGAHWLDLFDRSGVDPAECVGRSPPAAANALKRI